MSKTLLKIDTPLRKPSQEPSQMNFLQELLTDTDVVGSKDISVKLKNLITAIIKKCSLSRYQIAGRMSELLDAEISKAMIDAWTAESKEGHRFPAEYIPAFCAATGDISILELLCGSSNCQCVKSENQLKLELGILAAQEIALKERKKTLQARMKGDLHVQ